MNQLKNNGFEFLEFIRLKEEELCSFAPLAGRREGAETPKECAIRELFEETGQKLADMTFEGVLKVKNQKNGQLKFNPVYSAVTDHLQPFRENDETTEIKLWDGKEDIGWFDEVDIKILEYVSI
jgi:8-oxo-dGTP diphosphatase